jgi:hypothetical protein
MKTMHSLSQYNMEVSGLLHTLASSLPGNETLVCIEYEVVWAPNWSGVYGEEKISAPIKNRTSFHQLSRP